MKEFEKNLLDCMKVCSSFVVVMSLASRSFCVSKLCFKVDLCLQSKVFS